MKNILLAIILTLVLMSCKKDNDDPSFSLKQTDVTIHYDETHKFEVYNRSTVADPYKFTFTSSDEKVGTINNEGIFSASRIGEAQVNIRVSGGIELLGKVTVEPYFTLYREPSIEFGASIQAIKGHEERTLISETAASLLYEGENSNLEGVMYLFDNNKLDGAIVVLPTDEAMAEKIVTFYMERYEYEGTSDDVFYFSDEGKGLIIGIGEMESFGLTAAYFESDSQQAQAIMSNVKSDSQGDRPDVKSILIKRLREE